MTDFQWTSKEPLQAEVVAHVAAFSGLFVGPAIVMFILKYHVAGTILIIFGIIVAIWVLKT